MKIINRTNFDIGRLMDYSGLCENCATSLEYPGDMMVARMHETEDAVIYSPLDVLICPECGKFIQRVIIFKTLDITDELKGLKK